MKLFSAFGTAALAATLCATSGVFTLAHAAKASKAAPAAKAAQANDDEDIHIVKVNDFNFEKEIMNTDRPTILDISSTSCPPCLIMIPTLIDIATSYPDIKVATIGIDEPNIEKIKNTLPIQAFPTFYLIKDGRIMNRLVGAVKEEDLLAALQYTPKANAKKAKKRNKKKNLSCEVDGQFGGLQNHVTISFTFSDTETTSADIVTDVLIPPELESHKQDIMNKFIASGKGEVISTKTGIQLHTANDSRFMKAMDMKRTSTYNEMKAGLELQGFTCK